MQGSLDHSCPRSPASWGSFFWPSGGSGALPPAFEVRLARRELALVVLGVLGLDGPEELLAGVVVALRQVGYGPPAAVHHALYLQWMLFAHLAPSFASLFSATKASSGASFMLENGCFLTISKASLASPIPRWVE